MADLALSAVRTLSAALQCQQLQDFCDMLGYRSHLKDLEKNIPTVKTVLIGAVMRDGQLSPEEEDYIEKLKDAVYDADDLFDEVLALSDLNKYKTGLHYELADIHSETAAGAKGTRLSSSRIAEQTTATPHSNSRPKQKCHCKGINSGFNSFKWSFNPKEEGIWQIQAKVMGSHLASVMGTSVSNSTRNTSQKCKHKQTHSEINLVQSECKSETIKEKLRGGPVRAHFYLRECKPNWLVLGATDRRDCKEQIVLRKDQLNRSHGATIPTLPGSATQVQVHQIFRCSQCCFLTNSRELLPDQAANSQGKCDCYLAGRVATNYLRYNKE